MWKRKTQTMRTTREVVTAEARRGNPSIQIPPEYLVKGSTCPGGSPEDFPGNYFMRVGKKARILKMTGRVGGVFLTRAGYEHFKEDLKRAWEAAGNTDWPRFERSVNIFLGGVENEATRKARRAARALLVTLSRDNIIAGAKQGRFGLEVWSSLYTPPNAPAPRPPEDFPIAYFMQLKGWRMTPVKGRGGTRYLTRAGFDYFKPDLKQAYEAAGGNFADFEKNAADFYKRLEDSLTKQRLRLERELQTIKDFAY